MNESVLQARIKERAEKRVAKDVKTAVKVLANHPILENLRIGKLKLVSAYGYCPATDLFHGNGQVLLLKETNFEAVRQSLLEKYIAEETDGILKQLALLQDYMTHD